MLVVVVVVVVVVDDGEDVDELIGKTPDPGVVELDGVDVDDPTSGMLLDPLGVAEFATGGTDEVVIDDPLAGFEPPRPLVAGVVVTLDDEPGVAPGPVLMFTVVPG